MKSCIIGIRVSNHSGVLMRVASLFARRAFNIDSLTVGETETAGISRITVTTKCDEQTKKQIIKQLSKLHEVIEVAELDGETSVSRELLLLKVKSNSKIRQEIIDAVGIFRASIIDYGHKSMCIAITGESTKINAFIDLMKPFGIVEIDRTGIVALERGEGSLSEKSMNYINEMK